MITERFKVDTANLDRAFQQVDAVLPGWWGLDAARVVPSTRTTAYYAGAILDPATGLIDYYVADGTIVCTDNAISYVQHDEAGAVTVEASVDPLKFAMQEVLCASGILIYAKDIRDVNLIRQIGRIGDVFLTGLADGDALVYEALTGLWKNQSAALLSANVGKLLFGGFSSFLVPSGWNTTLQGFGLANVAEGTASIDVFATTNFATSTPHVVYTSATATNANAGWVRATGNQKYWRGNGAGLGGFTMNARLALKTVTTNSRAFFGVRKLDDGLNVGNIEPSAFVDCIGFGWDDSDTLIYLLHNDASGACTKTSTGEARNTGVVYEVEISCTPNGSAMTASLYSVTGSGRTLIYTSSPTTDLPTNTVGMGYLVEMNTGSATSPVAMRVYSLFQRIVS